MLDLEKITLKVREIALRAGAFLRKERSGFDRSKVEKKNAHDYVSYVDKESERRIVAQLRELLPEAGFIAEEGSGSLTTENYCWLVDPLDGTTNFIHNNAPYCVSIALRSKEELLVGVVYEVCRDELYWTYKGAPSYLNNKEIHVSWKHWIKLWRFNIINSFPTYGGRNCLLQDRSNSRIQRIFYFYVSQWNRRYCF